MKTALVIVDMQEDFETAHHESTVRNVIKAIKLAKQVHMPIVVLEYEYMGRTLKRIRKYLDDYEGTIYQTKGDDDGSYEVIKALRHNGFDDVHSLVVCGVNINACVSSTIRNLVETYDKTIKVIKNACWGHISSRKRGYASSRIYSNENVELTNLSVLCQTQ
jgi:nicotinamidase-related amidase